MILGTGVDIVEIDRLREAINKWGTHFLGKIFTQQEILSPYSLEAPMKQSNIFRIAAMTVALLDLSSMETWAHCDTMNGPVVKAGRGLSRDG